MAKQPGIFILFICLLLTGCRGDKLPIPTKVPEPAFKQEFSQGKLTVTVNLSRMEMNVAQQTVLKLTASAPEEYKLELPNFSGKLGEFTIIETRHEKPELKKDFLNQRISWMLEPFLNGSYIIPEITISARQGNKKFSVIIPEIQVKVSSLLAENKDLADIAPMLLPRPDYFYYYLAAGLALLACVLFAFYWLKLRKPPEPPAVPPVPPHITAIRALDELLARNLPEQGKIKEFYQAISAILRRYIENRFQLRAVEQTTEEFFSSLNSSSLFNLEQKQLLKKFLDHCDLVKFAKHEPTKEETGRMISFCREFITSAQ